MRYIRRANERGAADFGWLQSKHSFSFGDYYDNRHMGVSVLRVINDDTVAGGHGFGAHGHRDMEIISYVLSGALEHKDNQGNVHTVAAGEVQRMTAGTGVVHSEFNGSKSEPVKFLQIWVIPEKKGLPPEYEQKRIDQKASMTPIVTPNGKDGSLSIHQDISISRLILDADSDYTISQDQGRVGYLHVIDGGFTVNDSEEVTSFQQGDAVVPELEQPFTVKSGANGLHALWFDMPAKVNLS